MARINKKTGKLYVKGTRSPVHDEVYQATIVDAIRAINADPDLQHDDIIKAQLIKKLAGMTGQDLTNILNTIYKKAHGVTASTTTPLAEWAIAIVERRNVDKRR